MGPMKQLEKMFAGTRVVATCIMLGALVMTFVSVFVVGCEHLGLLSKLDETAEIISKLVGCKVCQTQEY